MFWKDYKDEQPEFDKPILAATYSFGLSFAVTYTRLTNIDRFGHHYQGIPNRNWRPQLWMYVPEIPRRLLGQAVRNPHREGLDFGTIVAKIECEREYTSYFKEVRTSYFSRIGISPRKNFTPSHFTP